LSPSRRCATVPPANRFDEAGGTAGDLFGGRFLIVLSGSEDP
jgi:hypothetical protein